MIISGDAKLVAGAFVKARGEMSATVAKDAKGVYGKYATLAAITEATSSAFSKHGLAIVQEASLDESGVTIDTWLIHESGGTIEFEALTMPLADRKPQSVGSVITYARRYQLASVCGLAPEDDDDAQNATQNATQPSQRGKEPPIGNSGHNHEGDVLFEQAKPKRTKLSNDEEETVMALGRTFYGDNWPKEQPRLAEWVSKGAVKRIADIMPVEAQKLITGLQKQIAAAEQAAVKASEPEAQAA